MFQHKLRELREKHGYKSQKAFADAFGVAQSTVGGWEAGKREPNYETTKRLALFFNVTVDYLLDTPGAPDIYLSDKQQQQLIKTFTSAISSTKLTEADIIVQSGVSKNFFPRLHKTSLHCAISNDLLSVAKYLNIEDEVSEIINEDHILDSFTYAMHKESKDLTAEDKEALLTMARQLNAAKKRN